MMDIQVQCCNTRDTGNGWYTHSFVISPQQYHTDISSRLSFSGQCLLASEELLRLQTPLACALRTPEAHLRRAQSTALEMCLGQAGQTLDEHLAAVQAVDAFDCVLVARLADHFLVELVECLDVVRREGDRDQDQIRLPLLGVLFHGIRCLRAEPGLGTDLRLVAETVRVGELEALHDGVDSCANLGRVRVAF